MPDPVRLDLTKTKLCDVPHIFSDSNNWIYTFCSVENCENRYRTASVDKYYYLPGAKKLCWKITLYKSEISL